MIPAPSAYNTAEVDGLIGLKRFSVLLVFPLLLLLLTACEPAKEKDPLFFRDPPCSFEGTWRKTDGTRTDFLAEADADGNLTLTVLSGETLQNAVFSCTDGGITLMKDGITLPVLRQGGICRFFELFSLPREELRSVTEHSGSTPTRELTFDTALLTVCADTGLPCRFETGGEVFFLYQVRTNRVES